MRLKTYHAPTLHAALRLARIELGSEAVLLEAKEQEAETAEARFQVTFALGADGELVQTQPPPVKIEQPHWKQFVDLPEPERAAKPELTYEPQPEPVPAAEAKPKPKARARKRATRKTTTPKPALAAPPQAAAAPAQHSALEALRTPELAALFGRLSAVGVQSTEAASLAAAAARKAGCDNDPAALDAALRATLDAGWRIHTGREPAADRARLLVLTGPPGAGKSASAVRLARLLSQAYARPAALVSLGRHPVGGSAALETWATLLDMPLEIVEAPEKLDEALDRLLRAPLAPGAIVLDAPSDGEAVQAALAAGAEVHLVLSATDSQTDLQRAFELYAPCRPSGVLFTKLDAAALPGVLWNLQSRGARPASFLGCGPATPGDLEPATAKRLTQRLLGR
ncbi:MAG: hypothetical protein H6509_09840 [Bryobacterales bacterium]|nr:hypothetical protein [Acidobacteriota bacterium]MCB9384907.1 hypothetical protein [Bryobacterales bacterium]